jgi:hypothetical protein
MALVTAITPEDVGLEHRPDHVQVDGAWDLIVGVFGRDLTGAGDAGVVDQHVKVAEALLDLVRGRLDGGRVGDVQGDRVRVAACRS